MSIEIFHKAKAEGRKISMVTVYDYTMARIVESSKVDVVLVGDSTSMVMHGHPNTTLATMDMMCFHTAAVARGLKTKFLIADVPFMANRKDLTTVMNNIEDLVQAGAQAVKMEGAKGNLEMIRHIVDSGVPVMGHLGLTPQFVNQFGGFKVQGRSEEAQKDILADAKALERAGCFSIVLECVPSSLAAQITKELKIPIIGIGAGMDVDGQVLVFQDMLGLNPTFKPKFVRTYAQGFEVIQNALNHFATDVQEKVFPLKEESYQE